MIPQHVNNGAFKKMIVSAMKGHNHSAVKHGVTAANMPTAIKKAMHEIKVNGVSASKYIHMDNGHKVTRHEAYQVMKGLKERGLAHHMQTTDTHHYVNRSFEHDHNIQEKIKSRNLEQRAKDMAQERNKASQKPDAAHGAQASALQHGSAPVHSAWSSAPHTKPGDQHGKHDQITHHPTNHIQVGHVTGSPLTGAEWHAHEAPAKLPDQMSPNHSGGGSISHSKPAEETIDLAID